MTIRAQVLTRFPARISAGDGIAITNSANAYTVSLSRSYPTRAAAIAAHIPASVDLIETLSYSTAGDGGGARYAKVVSQPSHPGKLQSDDGAWWELAEKTIPVRALGARVDGVTDDTTALNNCVLVAIARSGHQIIEFPAGTCLTKTINIQTNPTTAICVQGKGKGVTFLQLHPSSTSNGILAYRYADQPIVKDITFNANGLSINSDGLLSHFDCTNVLIENVGCIGFDINGIVANSVYNYLIRGCDVTRTATSPYENYGLTIVHTSFGNFHVRVLDNSFTNTGTILCGADCVASGNLFFGNGFGAAMAIESASPNTYSWVVSGNVIEGSSTVDSNGVATLGIESGAPDSVISGNIIRNVGGGAISVFGARTAIIGNELNNIGTATPYVSATTVTSVAIGTGSKSVTTQTGKLFASAPIIAIPQTVTITSAGDPTKFVSGTVTSYNTLTGALVINATLTGGAGSFSDGVITSSAENGTGIGMLYFDVTYNANYSMVSGNIMANGSYGTHGYREYSASLANIRVGENNFASATVAKYLFLSTSTNILAYTPVATPGSGGTYTTVTVNDAKASVSHGRTTSMSFDITFTNIGGGGAFVTITLPNTILGPASFVGGELTSGIPLFAVNNGSSSIFLRKYDGNFYIPVNGDRIIMGGTYVNA